MINFRWIDIRDGHWTKHGVGLESEYGFFCCIRNGVGVRFLLICWSRSLVSNFKIETKNNASVNQGCGSSRIFCASASSSSWSFMLPSSLSLLHYWDFLLPLPDKVGRFRVRFRFQLIFPKRFHFLQNFTASSFRFLLFLSNCMLTAKHKTENLMCRKSVWFTA